MSQLWKTISNYKSNSNCINIIIHWHEGLVLPSLPNHKLSTYTTHLYILVTFFKMHFYLTTVYVCIFFTLLVYNSHLLISVHLCVLVFVHFPEHFVWTLCKYIDISTTNKSKILRIHKHSWSLKLILLLVWEVTSVTQTAPSEITLQIRCIENLFVFLKKHSLNDNFWKTQLPLAGYLHCTVYCIIYWL